MLTNMTNAIKMNPNKTSPKNCKTYLVGLNITKKANSEITPSPFIPSKNEIIAVVKKITTSD